MYSNEKRNSLHMQLWTLEKRVKLSYWITFLILFSYVSIQMEVSYSPYDIVWAIFPSFIHIMHIHSTQLLWTIWIEMNAKYDVCFLWKFYSISKRKIMKWAWRRIPLHSWYVHLYSMYSSTNVWSYLDFLKHKSLCWYMYYNAVD